MMATEGKENEEGREAGRERRRPGSSCRDRAERP